MTLASSTRNRRALWTALVLVILVVVGATIQMSRADSSTEGSTPAGLTATSGVLVGDPEAPVTVDVYADLLCPACRVFEATTGETMHDLVASGEIKVRYHVIAFLDRASTNEYSTRSASTAYCAADSAHFAIYLRWLYAQQPAEGGPGHENDVLAELASKAGITGEDFRDCVDDERFAGYAARVTDAANQAGVTSTPTVIVAGEVLADRSPEGLLSAVDAATPVRSR